VVVYLRKGKGATWILPVRVSSKAGGNAILPMSETDTALALSITSVPKKGQANVAVIALLADMLGISKSRIQVIKGQTSRHKQMALQFPSDPSLWIDRLVQLTNAQPHWFQLADIP
jgi:uncharacterized protein (TIGR00251 family)